LALKKQADARFSQDTAALDEQLKKYSHGLDRVLRLQGMDVQELLGKAVNPEGLVNVLLRLISGCTGIPVRILTGSEAGELASSQDERNWMSRIGEHQQDWAEPVVLRPFVERMIEAGVLPAPEGGEFYVDWPDVNSPTDDEAAKTALTVTQALAAYWSSGAAEVMPPREYLINVLKMDTEEVDAILDAAEERNAEEEEKAAQDAADMADALEAAGGVAGATPPGAPAGAPRGRGGVPE